MRSSDFQANSLYRFVRRFGVRFQLRPTCLAVDEQDAEAGFELELYGSHAPEWNHADHSCAVCRTMLVGLLAIADRVLPPDRSSETSCRSTTRYVASAYAAEMKVEKTVSCRRLLSLATDSWALHIVEHTRDALIELGCREIRQEPASTHLQAHIKESLQALTSA